MTDTSAARVAAPADAELPLLGEPPAVELANTLYRDGDVWIEYLADPAAATRWVAAIAPRVGVDGAAVPDVAAAAALRSLRDAVRELFLACLGGQAPSPAAVRTVNDHAQRAPSARRLQWPAEGEPSAAVDHLRAAPLDVVAAVIAGGAIDLVAGPERADLRRCDAPGCGMLFVKDHPRRTWCNPGCGHRARQARYYRRRRARLQD